MTKSLDVGSEKPIISVITLVPGRTDQLEATLRSLFNQVAIFELILVCPSNFDYSIGFTENLMQRYPNCKMVTTPDSTPPEGVNNGLAIASGEFIYCLNAGDFVLPGAFSEFHKVALRNREIDVFVGHGVLFDESARVKGILFSKPMRPIDVVNNLTSFVHQSTFIKRTLLLEVGGFNAQIRTAYDLELLVKLYKSGHNIQIINSYWGGWTLESNSLSYSNIFIEERDRDLLSIHSEFKAFRFRKIRGLFSTYLLLARHPLRPLLHRGIFAEFWIIWKKIGTPGE